ncbi:MAG: acetyl-CoA carboxylase biotin carboxyl carrier protein subunit [Deltaproteobacteria bacterium]|nr:acetyl-CoA carboxylase biotin carboxyl carrier protein subunit [Deltaproteobacteria bacterium]
MTGPWLLRTEHREFRLSFRQALVSGVETEVVLDGQNYLIRWEPALKSVFLRKKDQVHEKVVAIHSFRPDDFGRIHGAEHTFRMELVACPPPCFRFMLSLAGPDKGFRRKSSGSQGQTIRSPMTGRIIRVCASQGDELRAGQVLMVIEAMKMENNICAPDAGVLRQLMVDAGQSVQTGADLALIVSGHYSSG